MARWEPDARGRLEQAALELYAERGFEGTTVADIATRAGLTKRTFFRYFADKREVLFSGQDALAEAYVQGIADAAEPATAMDLVTAGLAAAAALVGGRGDVARQRQGVVAASPDLQEREAVKRVTLAATITDALRRRGIGDPDASLAAELAVGVFKVSYARWGAADGTDLGEIVRDSLARMSQVTRPC